MTQEFNGSVNTDIDPDAPDSGSGSAEEDGGFLIGDDGEHLDTEDPAVDQQQITAGRLYQLLIKVDGVLESLGTDLGGGIPPASLTLVEGSAELGKSVLCQHFTYAALQAGNTVAFLTSNHTFTSFIAQMASIDLGISDYIDAEKISVQHLSKPRLGDDAGPLLTQLLTVIDHQTSKYKAIIVDAMTDCADNSDEDAIMDFITACHALRIKGRAIVIVADSSGFDEKVIDRFSNQCDIHIRLRGAKLGSKQVSTIEVIRSRNETVDNSNILRIEVRPKSGMRILPMPELRPIA